MRWIVQFSKGEAMWREVAHGKGMVMHGRVSFRTVKAELGCVQYCNGFVK